MMNTKDLLIQTNIPSEVSEFIFAIIEGKVEGMDRINLASFLEKPYKWQEEFKTFMESKKHE